MSNGYTAEEYRAVFDRAKKLQAQGMPEKKALLQAEKELPPRTPAVSAPPKPPAPRGCAKCGDTRPFVKVGSLVVGACGHPQPKEITR